MSEEEIQRFEYKLWFKGEQLKARDIADCISAYVQAKGGVAIQAQYGIVLVPVEDIGEDCCE